MSTYANNPPLVTVNPGPEYPQITQDRAAMTHTTPATLYIRYRQAGREYTAAGSEIDRLISDVISGRRAPLDVIETYATA